MNFRGKTLADIALTSTSAACVLEKYDLDYCSDGARLDLLDSDVRSAVEAELQALPENAEPETDWTAEPMAALLDHLQNHEHPEFVAQFQSIAARIDRVVKERGHQQPDLRHLPGIFAGMARDLEAHMRAEERDVFPRIRACAAQVDAGQPLTRSPLSQFGGPLRLMELEHESAGAALRLMREFTRDYELPGDACPRYRVLVRSLEELEERLLHHIYLENNVLYPRAAALKSAGGVLSRP